MVVQRRVGPLLAVLGAGLVVVLARAFQVQVLQHPIWESEASGMQSSSSVRPYERGRILDRNGVVLARDEDRFEIRLCYRDFRRGSPIAQVAHARSSLEMRAVTLPEAEEHLEGWARELVGLTPRLLRSFSAGGALPIGAVPELELDEAKTALRDRRATDLRYYAAELLDLPVALRKSFTPPPDDTRMDWSLLALAAESRGLPAAALEQELTQRLAETHTRLEHLAALVEHDGGLRAGSGATPLARLLELLEQERRRVEDDTADALFREAAGFDPGRVRTPVLEQRFDTAWIARALRWDDARLQEWITSRRAEWEDDAAEVLLPRVLAHAQEEPIRTRRADRLLSELALLFTPADEDARDADGTPRSWREFDEPCVIAELGSIFDRSSGARAPSDTRPALPFGSKDLDLLAQTEEDRWSIVGALCDLARGPELPARADTAAHARAAPAGWKPPAGSLEAAKRWRRLGEQQRSIDGDESLVELTWLFFALEERFQAEVERELELVYEDCGARSPLPFDAERRSRAAEAERYLLLDRSTRPQVLCKQPSWELVELVTRGASSYEGFSATHASTRVRPERDQDGVPLAAGLVGSVRRPRLQDLLSQGRSRARLAELRGRLVRSREEEAELRELSLGLFRNDEWTGGSGVENMLDKDLRGRNGFQEVVSLSDEAQAAGSVLVRDAIPGSDVRLTLDAELQRTAQDVLAHPEMPAGDQCDQLWVKYPVGAIVLLTPEGDVLAAASVPGKDGLESAPGRTDEHAHLRERTLCMPTVTPPGSCFKAFVAAYALDKLGLTEQTTFSCGEHGYKTIHCHAHGSVGLDEALVRSCNAYFGQVAEKFYKPSDFRDLLRTFGFGEPTGIAGAPEDGRGRLHENWKLPQEAGLDRELADAGTEMRFACGLSPMEATPMQVARATAGLATGTLPEVRLVDRIGDEEQPRRSRPLGISEKSLEIVRHALVGVVNEAGGTAEIEGLSRRTLGFTFACKTGSADVFAFPDPGKHPEMTAADRADKEAGKMRKHTWIAGWFPAEKPRAIVVVFMHDVSETATHSSIFLAAQFLGRPAVKRFALGEQGK